MCNKAVAQQRKVDNNILNKVNTKGGSSDLHPGCHWAIKGFLKCWTRLKRLRLTRSMSQCYYRGEGTYYNGIHGVVNIPQRRCFLDFFSMVRSGMKVKTHGIQVGFSQIQSYILNSPDEYSS